MLRPLSVEMVIMLFVIAVIKEKVVAHQLVGTKQSRKQSKHGTSVWVR